MVAKKRARTKKGTYVADDPSTAENEAWVEEKPKAKAKAKPKLQAALPPIGSAARKALILRGEIKE